MVTYLPMQARVILGDGLFPEKKNEKGQVVVVVDKQ